MYTTYFGFTQVPFNTKLDLADFFYGGSARKNESAILQAIKNSCGTMFLCGDSGVGKTTLLHRLADDLKQTHTFLFPKQLSSRIEPIIDSLYQSTGLDDPDKTVREKFDSVRDYLTNSETALANLVLVIDDAHELSPAVIAVLLGLARGGRETVPAFQILFAGPIPLKSLANDPVLQKFNLREACWCHLECLLDEEVSWFINQRLELAGYRGKTLFSDKAVRRIVDHSHGNLAKINVLCGYTLLNASLENRQVVTDDIVNEEAKHCLFNGDSGEMDVTVMADRDDTTHRYANENQDLTREVDLQDKTELMDESNTFKTVEKADLDPVDLEKLTNRYQELGIPIPNVGTGDEGSAQEFRTGNFRSVAQTWICSTLIARWGVVSTTVLVILSIIVYNGYSFYLTPPTWIPESETVSAQPVVLEKNDIQPVAAHQTLSAKGESPQSQDDKIQAMLLLAESQIASQRLFAPNGANALETYREIAKLVEHQMQTLNDLVQIKELYQRWGLEAEIQGNWRKAEKFYNQAVNLSPHDEELTTAIQRVRKQQGGADSSGVIEKEYRDLSTRNEQVLSFQS